MRHVGRVVLVLLFAIHGAALAQTTEERLRSVERGDLQITARGATAARSLKDRFADVVNVKDFGAKGDGATDDTASIQAAVSAGAEVFFPSGTYKVSGRITLPSGRAIMLRGTGAGSIVTRATAGEIFYRNTRGDLTEIDGLTFTGRARAFYYDAVDTPLPHPTQRYEFRIRNCRFLGDATDYAIYLHGAREGSIDNSYFESNKGIYREKAINTHVYGCHFKNTQMIVQDAAGSEGLIVVGGTALGCARGLWATGPIAGIQIIGVMWDFLDQPIVMAGVHDAVITGSYISTRTPNPAVWVGANGGARSRNVKIVGNAGIMANGNNPGDGNVAVRIESTDHFEVGSNVIGNWKVNGLEYSGSTLGVIHDNDILPRGTFGKYSIAAGSDDATIKIHRNDLGKPISRSVTLDIWDNSGFVTENSGEASSGSGPGVRLVTIPHGLAMAPRKGRVKITPTSVIQSGLRWWVYPEPDAKNIYLTTDVDITTPFSVAWQAQIKP